MQSIIIQWTVLVCALVHVSLACLGRDGTIVIQENEPGPAPGSLAAKYEVVSYLYACTFVLSFFIVCCLLNAA